MSKSVRKTISLLLILVTLFSLFAVNANAAQTDNNYDDEIMPCFTMIRSITTSFSISGITSTSFVELNSQQPVMLIIKIELQRKESGVYKTIETWTQAGSGKHIAIEKKKVVNIFYDHRIKVTCTAGSETHVTYDYP